MEEYLGVIKIFAGNFAPRGFMLCQGQILSIAQNTALFSILGTTYGGNGTTTFALPNLQGIVPIGQGNSPQGGTYDLGETAGTPNVSILTSNLPAHVHAGPGTIGVSAADATISAPVDGASIATPGTTVARAFSPTLGFTTATPSVNLASTITTGATGGNIPVSIMQPYLAINYIICVSGLFPSRN
ncbi:Microcystin-dependent protein [Flavobacterium sp. CF108]|uniref:phage tail protein n=1 Tax=unclassified Flavobacterium TaxID=196869 RepID=UPI0008D19BF1|nr:MULTISPECIES: tail fiber protein [unclassified Flavobacterium]SEO67855.1 Microcystin-dependent protein [Flavobacterium sp. fv08]SHH89559.1 Microcystin-dependent protein [Flavobacterium sp. CF108]